MNETINDVYQITMSGLRNGDSVEKYEKLIDKYTMIERFEYCAGMKKAIDKWKKMKKMA